MSIFQKKTGYTDYFDQIMIAGYPFDIAVRVREKRGDPSAIHCGRIVTFELTYENEFIAYYDNGNWDIDIDPSMYDPEFFDIATLARDLMLRKWSNPEKLKTKCEKTDLF